MAASNNYTLLHHAALNGHTSTAELLLMNGASIEATDRDGNTPLHLSTWKGHIDVVKLLLDNGASIHAINSYFNTSLHLAA